MTALNYYYSDDISQLPLQKRHLSLGCNVGVLHLDRAVVEATDLLRVNDTLLSTAGGVEVNLGLPGRNALHKHLLNVLESLSSCLGEHEEGVDCHGCAEDTKDDVDFPLDVDEGRRDEV
mgnify:CR=1 FL=1